MLRSNWRIASPVARWDNASMARRQIYDDELDACEPDPRGPRRTGMRLAVELKPDTMSRRSPLACRWDGWFDVFG